MPGRRLTFVVAEDKERMRDYLARKTAEIDRLFECVGTAADGEEAVELVERHLPDLLITDIKMPVMGDWSWWSASVVPTPSFGSSSFPVTASSSTRDGPSSSAWRTTS